MPGMRPRVLEALVLPTGEECEADRTVITRVLIMVSCNRKSEHQSSDRSGSKLASFI